MIYYIAYRNQDDHNGDYVCGYVEKEEDAIFLIEALNEKLKWKGYYYDIIKPISDFEQFLDEEGN